MATYGGYSVASGQYYAPSPTSTVQQTRLVVPQFSRLYRYQSANQQSANQQSANQPYTNQQYPQARYQGAQANQPGRVYVYRTNKNDNNQRYVIPQTQNGQYNQGFNTFGQQQQRPAYAGGMPYTSNGEQVKTRRYQIHRPGIQKEFYDVEERVIVRPVGSALIELDPPFKKVAKNEVAPNRPYGQNYASEYGQYNSRGFSPRHGQFDGNRNQYAPSQNNQADRNGQYFSHPGHLAQNCDYFVTAQTPIYEYGTPATTFGPSSYTPTQTYGPTTPGAYHPTTFAPSTTTGQYPTENGQYPSTSVQTTTNEYPSTTYSPTSSGEYPTTTVPSQTQSSDIYISSTTPVAVTIVDNANNQTQQSTPNQDIVYANNNNNNNRQQFGNENSPDQFRNELPPRGDISQYQNEPSDQFYHELPRDRYTNTPENNNNNRYPQNVYSKSKGDPTESPAYYGEEAEVVEINPRTSKNFTSSNRNRTSNGNTQQQRLIALYTGNGGISEVGQEEESNGQYNQYQGEQNGRYTAPNYQNNQFNGANGQSNQFQNGANGRYTAPNGQYQDDNSGRYTTPNAQNNQFQNGANGQYQDGTNGRFTFPNDQNSQLQNGANERYTEPNGQYQDGTSGRYTAPNAQNNQFQNERYTAPNQYQDVGNVRARIVSVTPTPPSVEPSETVNKRRIVVSKPVTTVQEVVEEDDKPETDTRKGNYRSGSSENGRNFNQNSNQDYENSGESQSNEYNANYNADPNSDYDQRFDGNSNENTSNYNNNRNFNGGSSKNANYNDDSSKEKTNGFYISTTPSTASQRIIYVQPVTQDFAQQKAVAPKKQ